MGKGKNRLKAKLQTAVRDRAPPFSSVASSSTPVLSVEELLRNRPAVRSSRHSTAYTEVQHGSAAAFERHQQWIAGTQESALRRAQRSAIAGPAPPASWREIWTERVLTTGMHSAPEPVLHPNATGAPSLRSICANAVAKNIRRYKGTAAMFRSVPFYLRAVIMLRCVGLSDDLLPLFAGDDMRMWTFVRSKSSVAGISKHLLGVVLEEEEEDGFQEGSSDNAVSNSAQPEVDSWEDYADIPTLSTPTLLNVGRNTLANLHNLRMYNIPSLPHTFTTLLCRHVPQLSSLTLENTYNPLTGPSAFSAFARQLHHLVFLDVSYCGWVDDSLVADIGWEEEETVFPKLRWLAVVDCRFQKSPEDSLKTMRPQVKLISSVGGLRLSDVYLQPWQ
ncbi:hypothetical protein BC832DRAFT_553838 [Gaertneriomyces semiglobifer]|nr:hypothetical protein BC832DRAFT_553838 [Gaertneriomyces semiglobifer]